MIHRRGLLLGALAAFAAPAIVRADSLMKLYVPRRLILWGDGVADDTEALQALINGEEVLTSFGGIASHRTIPFGAYLTGSPLVISEGGLLLSGISLAAKPGFQGESL